MKAAVEHYLQLGCSDEALPKVMYENAARFLGIEYIVRERSVVMGFKNLLAMYGFFKMKYVPF